MTTSMNATTLLREQHDEVRWLFKQLEEGASHPGQLVHKLANNLAAHIVIEQELFYPAVLDAKQKLVLEGFEEHAVGRFALKRLVHTHPSEREFPARLKALKDVIEHHADEEELELFRAAERVLGDTSSDLCASMKTLFEATKKVGYEQTVARGGAATTSATARGTAAYLAFAEEQP